VSIAVHRWIIYLFLLFWWLILIFTDLLISPVKFYVPTGWEHQYGTLYKPMIVFGIYLLSCHFFILYRGIKSASNAIQRKARVIAFSGLVGRDVIGFLLGTILPLLGLQAHSFYGLAPIYMCFLLTYGLLRMQWETIQELRNGLEEKVALRTEELEEANKRQGIQFPFEIRCGIHTGMANVGNYGSEGFMEYSAIGLNTNLPSRLEQACQPGEI